MDKRLETRIYNHAKEEGLQRLFFQIEKTIVEKALNECRDNRQHAADLLGINRTTYVEKLKRFKRREAPMKKEKSVQTSY